jgi:hypothetical protein
VTASGVCRASGRSNQRGGKASGQCLISWQTGFNF